MELFTHLNRNVVVCPSTLSIFCVHRYNSSNEILKIKAPDTVYPALFADLASKPQVPG